MHVMIGQVQRQRDCKPHASLRLEILGADSGPCDRCSTPGCCALVRDAAGVRKSLCSPCLDRIVRHLPSRLLVSVP